MSEGMDQMWESVDRLTQVTKQWADAGGRRVIFDAPPLLVELQREMTPSMQPGSHGSGDNGAPIALGAFDILVEISGTVEREFRRARLTPGSHVVRGGGLTTLEKLRYWATVAQLFEKMWTDCADITAQWVAKIEHLLDPPKITPLVGHACPMCWQDQAVVQLEAGEFGRQPALSFMMVSGDAKVQCQECGATWWGDEVVELTAGLGGDTQKAKAMFATGN